MFKKTKRFLVISAVAMALMFSIIMDGAAPQPTPGGATVAGIIMPGASVDSIIMKGTVLQPTRNIIAV